MTKSFGSSAILNSINEIISTGKKRETLQLYTEDEVYNGRTIKIKSKSVLNFGSCSYLGLETDQRIKQAAIEAIQAYGVHLSSSRAYLSTTLYAELEFLMKQIFGHPVVLTSSVSLGHQAVLPVVVEEGDLILLDQQVHASVQVAASLMQLKGVSIMVLRHNNMQELEEKLIEHCGRYNRIWYMADGIYSMYGDAVHAQEIEKLLNKYRNFYLYVDDAHGMSWAGEHGNGFVLSQMDLHEKMVLASSLGKGFGIGGGIFVFKDQGLCNKVRNCGGPLIFSGPHPIPVVAASIASAKIHLSDEIHLLQKDLKKKMMYCSERLRHYGLPLVSKADTPINFIGLGLVRVGYNLVQRLLNAGFYTNLAVFPAVPESCTGLRFTITRHHRLEDIEALVKTLAFHLPKALADEGRTSDDIKKAFRKNLDPAWTLNTSKTIGETKEQLNKETNEHLYTIEHETSIKNIPEDTWNELLGRDAALDWKGLLFLEQTFSANILPEYNWGFHYYIIRDENKVPVLATYLTHSIVKDDMLAPAAVSQRIEAERINDPYYLCSTVLMMGCVMSVGKHIYIDRSRPDWKNILMLLLDAIWSLQDLTKAAGINLRDFDAQDAEISSFLADQGFIQVAMPDTHIIKEATWTTKETFLESLDTTKRYTLKKDVFKFEHLFKATIVKGCTKDQLLNYYALYKNVARKSFEITGFDLPFKLFSTMLDFPGWEILDLRLKAGPAQDAEGALLAVSFSYVHDGNYNFLIVGMDYDYLHSHNVYKQILWQTVLRARQLNCKHINLGLTASQNKRKFGAAVVPQLAFVQAEDTFNRTVIQAMANSEGGK